MYEDTIVVCALGDNENEETSGSAHVFVRSGETWTHQAKLVAPEGAADYSFGGSAAIYEDTIVVGATYIDDEIVEMRGSAHVFVLSGEEWSHQARMLAPGGTGYNQFGESVAIYGDTIVVSASYFDDEIENMRGSAHVFVRRGEEWIHQAKLLAPDGARGDWFWRECRNLPGNH